MQPHFILLTKDHHYISNVETIYQASFPIEEKVLFDKIITRKLSSQCKYHLFAITDYQDVIGMISIVCFDTFVFIFYLAIREDKQGLGLGEKTLAFIKKYYNKPIVLEVEKGITLNQKRRIAFYERNGFCQLPYYYEQPALHAETESIEMILMYNSGMIPANQFEEIKQLLYQFVYDKMP